MPSTARISIDKEIERRKDARRTLQIQIDLDELDRRAIAVETGHSRLISSEEFWDNVKKAEI
jgi:hypothetical protein